MSFIGKLKVGIITFVLFGVVFFAAPVFAMRRVGPVSRNFKVTNMIDERKLRFELSQRTSIKKIKIAPKVKERLKFIPLNGTDYTFTVVAYQDGDTFYIAPKKSYEPIYAPKNCRGLFCMTSAQEIDLEGLYTSEVENMSGMFYSCRELKTLNLGHTFDTSKVTDMSYMFSNCEQLNNLELGECFNTSRVRSMKCMFAVCQSLRSLDLKDRFDTSSVTDMTLMFSNCLDIIHLNLRDHFDISRARKNMNAIFENIPIDIQLGEYTVKSDTNGVHLVKVFSLLKKARSGDVKAMKQLGDLYCIGVHTPKDMEKAVCFYRKAVEFGSIESMVCLGDCCYSGEGVTKDVDRAVRWYERAAERGNVDARIRLGGCYLRGEGKRKDVTQAQRLYYELLDVEDAEASFGIGECCFETKENRKAITWYLRAISSGSANAKFRLAERYYMGRGVKANIEQALEYFCQLASDANIKMLHNIVGFYNAYRAVDEKIWNAHTAIMANHCYKMGKIYYGNGQIDFESQQNVFALFECAAKLGNKDAAKFLYECYWTGKEVKQDTLQAVRWLVVSANHRSTEGDVSPSKSLSERIEDVIDFLNKEQRNVVVWRYFAGHFKHILDFFDEKEMVYVLDCDTVLLDTYFLEKMISEGSDIIRLKIFLSEAEMAVEAFKAVMKNDDTVSIFEKINACIDKKIFEKAMRKYGFVLNEMFFGSYVTSKWRTVSIPEESYTDEGIQMNIYDTVLTDADALLGISNVYDYIFLDRGSWTRRFYELEQCDNGQARELLAREMYWLRSMTDRDRAGVLDDRQKEAFEVCRNLFKTHFLSATRACKNELANIMLLWAKDIDEYEVATGEGLRVVDQETVDLFVQMLCRTCWIEKMVDYIELSKFKDDEDVGAAVKEMLLCLDNEVFGQEYRNYFRFIIAGLLNDIVVIGNSIAENSILTAEKISNVIAKMISVNDICKVARQVYMSIADEREAVDVELDGSCKTTMKEKLVRDIETRYEVSYLEFCTIVNLTCEKDFEKRFEEFLASAELGREDESFECLKDWKSGKVNLPMVRLTWCAFDIDVMFSKCDLIPELMRFTKEEASLSSESLAEYYSKVLYPIYLWKSKMIDLHI